MKPRPSDTKPLRLANVLTPLSLFAAATFASAAEPAPVDADPIVLDPFTINAESDRSYTATQATTGSLVATDIISSPFTIGVVNRQLIDDLQIDTFEDLGRMSTVSTSNRQSNPNNITFARGFQMQELRNGYAPGGRLYLTPSIERVEILRGPNSVLYGLANPGGGINFISKLPKFKAATETRVSVGSHDHYQAMLDTTGPIPVLGREALAYRFVAAVSESGGDRPFEDNRYLVLAPSLTLRPFRALEITAEYEYIEYDFNEVSPAPFAGPDYDRTNLGRYDDLNAIGPDGGFENVQRAFGGGVTFTPTDWLAVRYRYNATERKNPRVVTWNINAASQRPQFGDGMNDVDGQTLDAAIRYGFAEFAKGTLLLGYEENSNYFETPVYRFSEANVSNTLLFPQGIANATPDQLRLRDTSNPAGGYPPARASDLRRPENLSAINGQTTNDFTNYRLVNTLKLFDERLVLLTGYSWAEASVISAPPESTVRSQKEEPYQFGLTFNVLKNRGALDTLALYGQKATSFRNQFGADAFNRPIPPNNGQVEEVGLKFSMYGGKLVGWVAAFDQVQKNIARDIPPAAVDDPNTPRDERAPGIREASGLERARGFDLRFDYTPNEAWTFSLEGSFFSGEVVSDAQTPAREGLELANVPERSLVFIGSRRFVGGPLAGLTFGAVVAHNNDYVTNNANLAVSTRRADEMTILDVFAKYESRLWGRPVEYNLKFENVTNERDYVIFNGTWGEPLNVKASMRLRF